MNQFHERPLAGISAERRRLSRRGMLTGAAALAGGVAALRLGGLPLLARAQDDANGGFASDLDVLN